ncbi:MAG: alanine:cation symporter family protein [Lachnospiraceae bacterium]|nr:alanine:cation symporter family protein [Lachnospiraceae bacterium]
MDNFLESVAKVNDVVNGYAWGWPALIMLLGTGLICTIITKCFQVSHLTHWWRKTIGSVFSKDTHKKLGKHSGSVSQFQALCTALAATIGTGNIAGVAAAICVGGPGAVFWMWVAAFLGMMTNFSENILGIYFRRKNENGEWSGGAMYYLRDGLGGYKGMKHVGKVLAVIFAVFAILASFGIGNMGQINKITLNIESAFFTNVTAPTFLDVSIVNWIIGIVLMIIGGFIILGGLQRIASFAEKVVPFMAVVYVVGALIIMCCHITMLGEIFAAIFKFAFTPVAVAGGVSGSVIKMILDGPIKNGCKRGVFSNEAGLGSSVMVHSNSNVKEPVKQGLWGIFEVFADTIVVCTMTAIVVLSSGAIDLATGVTNAGTDDATLVAKAFGNIFGKPGEWFIAVAVLLFAFTTVMGWSHYGSKAVEYLFGVKGGKVYRVIFVLMMISGAIMTSTLAWDISDTFNGLMMLPNLIGVLAMTPLVIKITRNYVDRKINGKDIEPILSYDPAIQAEYAPLVKQGEE